MSQWQIGIDLGGTTYSVGLVDQQGVVHKQIDGDTLPAEGAEKVLRRLCDAVDTVLQSAGVKKTELRGIGIGAPGLHDVDRGICIHATNLGWNNVPITEPFETAFGVPAMLENDVKCAVLAEHHFGAGQGVADMMLITLGTGVGGAFIANNRLVRGFRGFAGEIGHHTIQSDGAKCGCGNLGCVEAYIGTQGIIRRAQAAYGTHPPRIIIDITGGDVANVTPRHIAEAAEKGEPISRRILEETGYYLGICCANAATIVNPERIVIGGGIARAGDSILEPARREMKRRVSSELMIQGVEVVQARLGTKAGIIGAATLAWSHVVQ